MIISKSHDVRVTAEICQPLLGYTAIVGVIAAIIRQAHSLENIGSASPGSYWGLSFRGRGIYHLGLISIKGKLFYTNSLHDYIFIQIT